MRTYRIEYYAERNDTSTDLEIEIEADSILEALQKFSDKYILHKRVVSIKELPYNKPIDSVIYINNKNSNQ